MVDNKKDKIQPREAYEPVKVEVMTVVPQGILCVSYVGLQSYKRSL